MKSLPDEIIEIIVEYLRNRNNHHHQLTDYDPLLLLRTICKEWKEIAEHSRYWLEKQEFFIVAPNSYRLYVQHPSYVYGSGNEIIVHIDEEIRAIPKDVCKIKVVRNSPSLRNSSPIEAFVICTKFLEKRRYCHNAWQYFFHWDQKCRLRIARIKTWFSSGLFFFLCVFSVVCLIFSISFLSDVKKPSNSLSIIQNVGFGCIYWCCIFYSISLALVLIHRVYSAYIGRYEDITGKVLLLTSRDCLLLFATSLIISGGVSFALLQAILSENDSEIQFVFVSFPFWIFFLFTCVIIYRNIDGGDDHTITCCAFMGLMMIGSTITMVGLYSDSPSHYGIQNLGIVLFPLLFPELGLFYIVYLTIWDSLNLIRTYWKGESIVNHSSALRVGLRFFVNFMKTSSIIGEFILILNLFYQGVMNNLSLSTSITMILLFVLLIQVGFYFKRFDSKYL